VDAQAVRALFYDGLTSGSLPAAVMLTSAGVRGSLQVQLNGTVQTIPLEQVCIGERVGSVNRILGLPSGGSLEVLDNPAFDVALEAAGVRTLESRIRRLEARWPYALLAAVATLVGSAAFLRYGMPPLAAHAVHFIPTRVDALVAQDTLHILDRTTFSASALPADRQSQLRALFAEVTSDAHAPGIHFDLQFRKGGAIGANALALPSGIVILTDELVALSHDDDELRGVLAHEVGHLVNRHAMRMLVQSSGTTLLLVALFGDVSSASSLAAAAPAVLVSSAYSRDFERQADGFAFHWMALHGLSPARFADLLSRLAAAQGSRTEGYLASHPDIQERVDAARQQQPPAKPH
jgi:Zn-dependent protease with chaperone function